MLSKNINEAPKTLKKKKKVKINAIVIKDID
jgi:hypothetical protein